MAVPNLDLQRHISASGRTQQQVADAVNRLVAESTGQPGRYTDETIRRYLRGERTWPHSAYRTAFRQLFDVATDAELGFFDQRVPPTLGGANPEEDPLRRSEFLRATAGAAVLATPLVDLIAVTQPTPIPAMVGKTEIHGVLATAKAFSTWDNTYGGGLVREAVAAQLRYAVGLLHARSNPTNRGELYSAVGFLSLTAGWMAFDAFAHDDARRMLRLALTCAEEVGDAHLRAEVLSRMARQAIWCGDPDTGLTLAELALVRSDRLTATERANLNTVRARAFSALHRIEEAVGAIGQADEEFSNSSRADDPVWMAYYDAAQHSGDTGHALYDIALQGRFISEARCRLQAAAAGHGDTYARSRAFSAVKHASLTMATGDPAEATAIAQRALSDAESLRSNRAHEYLRELRAISGRHAALGEVADLRARINKITVTV